MSPKRFETVAVSIFVNSEKPQVGGWAVDLPDEDIVEYPSLDDAMIGMDEAGWEPVTSFKHGSYTYLTYKRPFVPDESGAEEPLVDLDE